MKLNVVTSGKRFLINVDERSTILKVKRTIRKFLHVNSPMLGEEGDEKDEEYLQPYHNRTLLPDALTLQETGLQSGTTVRCVCITTRPYTLKIFVPCLAKSVLLREEVTIDGSSVGEVKTLVQSKLGLPVSSFKLKRETDDVPMFDEHSLSYYGIEHGELLVVVVWKDVERVLVASMKDDISQTFFILPNIRNKPRLNRYCLRIILFVAAHMDFVNLASEVINCGIRYNSSHPLYSSKKFAKA